MRAASTLLLLCGCYVSHSIGESGGADASVSDVNASDGVLDTALRRDTFFRGDAFSSDARFRDASDRDARFSDASVIDASSQDSGADALIDDASVLFDGSTGDASVGDYIRARPCPGGLSLTRGQLEWPSVDCGYISDVQLLAMDDGRLLGIATEVRGCDDRPAHVLGQYTTLMPRGVFPGEEFTIGTQGGPAYAATDGREVAVCSGNRLVILEGESVQSETTLPSPPGCMSNVICTGVAYDGEGWVVLSDTPGCAVSAQILRVDRRGGLRGSAAPVGTSLDSISSSPIGVDVLSAPRADSAVYHRWTRASAAPDTRLESGVRSNARVSGIGAWPYEDGALALVFAYDEGILLRVIDARGTQLLERFRASFRTTPTSLSIQSTTFGLAVGVSYEPQGVAKTFFLDERGNDVGEPFEVWNGGNVTGQLVVDLAWTNVLFMHMRLSADGATANRTLVIGKFCND